MHCDARRAWWTAYPNHPDVPIRIEAGSYRGRPVHFEVLAPWTEPWRVDTVARNGWATNSAPPGVLAVVIVIFFAAALLARRNLRLGRADRRGAFRTAGFVFGAHLLTWELLVHHVPSLEEFSVLSNPFSDIVLASLMIWTLYLALEPYVRRLWPDALVSWSRLLAGRLRDPMIGRDVVVGALAGLGGTLLVTVGYPLVRDWLGERALYTDQPFLGSLAGIRQTAGALANNLGDFIGAALILFLLVVLRLILRKTWAAGLALVLLTSLPVLFLDVRFLWLLVLGQYIVAVFVLIRFGYLALAVLLFFQDFDISVVLTTDFSAWYAGRSLFVLLVVAAIAGWGFYLSLGGRRPFGDATLDEEIGEKRYGPAG